MPRAFSWFKKDLTCIGSVLFRGSLAPRPEELDGLQAHGIQARTVDPGADDHWKPTFQALLEELAEFSLPALVKLGYVVDGGGENDREHLWFEVHACRAEEIEGTLVNQPFHIERMQPGQRSVHPVSLISDWMIMTPLGSITPSFDMALREVRSRTDELRRIIAEAEAQPDPSA